MFVNVFVMLFQMRQTTQESFFFNEIPNGTVDLDIRHGWSHRRIFGEARQKFLHARKIVQMFAPFSGSELFAVTTQERHTPLEFLPQCLQIGGGDLICGDGLREFLALQALTHCINASGQLLTLLLALYARTMAEIVPKPTECGDFDNKRKSHTKNRKKADGIGAPRDSRTSMQTIESQLLFSKNKNRAMLNGVRLSRRYNTVAELHECGSRIAQSKRTARLDEFQTVSIRQSVSSPYCKGRLLKVQALSPCKEFR